MDSDVEIVEDNRSRHHKHHSKNSEKQQSSRKRKRSTSGQIDKNEVRKGTETELGSFVIDRTETNHKRLKIDQIQKSIDEPSDSSWKKKLEESLLGFETPEADKSVPRFKKRSCYNCDGDHNLSECTKPKDFRRISMKRRECGDEIRNRQMRTQRITDDFARQKDKTFFKPGVLSRELRDAMGIGRNDIPDHIYRMRRMGFIKGYPPGYLKRAIKNHSSDSDMIKIFEIDNKKEVEEKEKKVETAPELDEEKIICYPGFNEKDNRLIDLENFKIPVISVFCEKYQEELNDLFKRASKSKRRQDKKNAEKKKKLAVEEDDDIMIIDKEGAEDNNVDCITPGEEKNIEVMGESLINEMMQTPKKSVVDDSINEGDSLCHTIGTPVFSVRNEDGSVKKVTTPSLEAFSVGIIPFEAREEDTQNKGMFQRLMNQLKASRAEMEAEKKEGSSSDKEKTQKKTKKKKDKKDKKETL